MPSLYEYEPNDYEFADRRADHCDDQLPLFSSVGRGIKGDDSRIVIADPDTECETHLKGLHVDNATGVVSTDWISENINGGRLMYQYNLRPYTIPRTFTITFKYKRPGRKEWSWTTPAIPYIWTVDNEDGTVSEKPEHIVGSGVATIFLRTKHTEDWVEKLVYPEGFDRDDFNAPEPEEAWSANIVFGYGGDVEVPDFDDIAKIIGITKQDVFNILEDNSITIDGYTVENIVDYIMKVEDHIHKDQGFGDDTLVGDDPTSVLPTSQFPNGVSYDGTTYTNPMAGKPYTIKNYIDYKVWEAKLDLLQKMEVQRQANNQYFNNIYGLINDIVSHISGASLTSDSTAPASTTADKNKKIVWPSEPSNTAKIPMGNINVLSDDRSKAIITHTGNSTGDLRGK